MASCEGLLQKQLFPTLLLTLLLKLQTLQGYTSRPPWYMSPSCGFPAGTGSYPAEWIGSAHGRVRVTREDSYVYLGYEFRCERREENVTVARAKTGGVSDLIMCFNITVLSRDLVVMRLYTKEVMRTVKSGFLTTVQYMCDRYQLADDPAASHWNQPHIPAWDFLVFVREGSRPAKDCPRMLRDTWRLDTTFRREPCIQWQYLLDVRASPKRLRFIHNTEHMDLLNTRGRRDFTCLYSVDGEDNMTYVVLLNDDNRDENFTCLAYTPDMVGRPYGALMKISPLEGSTCGMFPNIESLDKHGVPVTLQRACSDPDEQPITSKSVNIQPSLSSVQEIIIAALLFFAWQR